MNVVKSHDGFRYIPCHMCDKEGVLIWDVLLLCCSVPERKTAGLGPKQQDFASTYNITRKIITGFNYSSEYKSDFHIYVIY